MTVEWKLTRDIPAGAEHIFRPEALHFVARLHALTNLERLHLLAERRERQARLDRGEPLDFFSSNQIAANQRWRVRDAPADLACRFVEITGPASDRKGVINRLNSGADCDMEDFEDSLSPTWRTIAQGQVNLFDAVRRTIVFNHEKKGLIGLNEKTATLIVRHRGLHLSEAHMLVEGARVSATVFDIGMFLFHNAKELLARGSAPYLYSPKLEGYQEANWLDGLLWTAEEMLDIPCNSVRTSILIESIVSTFEAEEMLCAQRHRITALNVGRWDEIASFAKKFRQQNWCVLPGRGQISMTGAPFMQAYDQHITAICHARGAHAQGGMAADVRVKDPEFNRRVDAAVLADAEREAREGKDGKWVAMPDFVPVARTPFERLIGDNLHQIATAPGKRATRNELLAPFTGPVTAEDLLENAEAKLEYLANWFDGTGAVGIHYYDSAGTLKARKMDDAATVEISRELDWKWLRAGVVTRDQLIKALDERMATKPQTYPYAEAYRLIVDLLDSENPAEYITIPAYEKLLELEDEGVV